MTIQEAMAKAGLASKEQAQEQLDCNMFKALWHDAEQLIQLKTPATQSGNRGPQSNAQR